MSKKTTKDCSGDNLNKKRGRNNDEEISPQNIEPPKEQIKLSSKIDTLDDLINLAKQEI